jgi:Fe-S-cluster-containing dehydrogenase component
MDESRRRFVKGLGLAALGAGTGFPLLEGARLALAQGATGQDPSPAGAPTAVAHQWAMVVDVEKCLRETVRRACIEACDRVHNVPHIPQSRDAVEWIWSEQFEDVFPDQVNAHSAPELRDAPVLVLCNHCTTPPCIRVCPTGATWKRPQDGIVMMDMHRCIGCRYCMAACPYGARSFNWMDPRPYVERDAKGKPLSDFPTRTKGVVEKCTFCAERIDLGQVPACVEAANALPEGAGALTFGDLGDPYSAVSRILRDRQTVCRRAALGTGPNVYYVTSGLSLATLEGAKA